ncbi:hypothetical protein E1B28_010593 [Marasmius oreades]|uniref:Uncharacterized protein n=1 Tax=Marasmius oreades TaxID=181124 RepID=A0A9P7RXD8_9AGAR|nr:uncharacterized protein E1B28_010593 [Marasmius oreades]KAG7091569.1 hypothetical protein E1B28_010593 [Marasmius oreades]
MQIGQVQKVEKVLIPSDWHAMVNLRNELVDGVRGELRRMTVAGVVFIVITNLVTELVLLSRCYLVWGSRRRFVVVPGVFSLTATVFGIWNAITLSRIHGLFVFTPIIGSGGPKLSQFVIFVFAALFSNLLLGLMIAGRLIYITRCANRHMALDGKGGKGMYYSAAATALIIMCVPVIFIHHLPNPYTNLVISISWSCKLTIISLESGLLYHLVLLIYTIIVAIGITNSDSPSVYWHPTKAFVTAHAVFYYSMIQIAGIVPTLIIVRFGLGVTVGDKDRDVQVQAGYDDVPVRDLQTVFAKSPSGYLDVEKVEQRSSLESVGFEVPRESGLEATVGYAPVHT